mmetsp:Transcript_55057/g.87331  ORF Transcript_55057/g.87331 Transcript_55057/m.87331 type:complete len:175 (+) Transcript_55057:49-573(+)
MASRSVIVLLAVRYAQSAFVAPHRDEQKPVFLRPARYADTHDGDKFFTTSRPENCGLNTAEPDRVRPGCDIVICEDIENAKDCKTAGEHGHECSWGGDDRCHTPPHLRRAPREDADIRENESWIAGIAKIVGRFVLVMTVISGMGLCCAFFLQGPAAVRQSIDMRFGGQRLGTR